MMRDWLLYQSEFQAEIISSEGHPMDASCASCWKQDGQYRCSDCFRSGLYCQDCCVSAHAALPFHSITQWNGRYFEKTTLQALGFVLHLGHGGSSCPQMSEEGYSGTELTVVDLDGIYIHTVAWCACTDPAERWKQLLRTRLYPASVQFPRTAFTFRLLNYFNMDILECDTSSASFMTKLRRLTNLYDPMNVPVSTMFVERCTDIYPQSTGSIPGVDEGINSVVLPRSPSHIWFCP